MLAFIAPSQLVSNPLVQTLPLLLARETHDAAVFHLASVIPRHINFLFQANESLSRETMTLLAKEMNSTKPALRRAFCSVVGNVLWQCGDLKSEASLAFANAVLPSLESNLKTTALNPLTSPPGPLAGYIALAVLMGPLSRSGKFGEQTPFKFTLGGNILTTSRLDCFVGDIITRNPTVQSLVSTSTKPSFLLWEKVYKKTLDFEEEKWLIRACEATLTHCHAELEKSSSLRYVTGPLSTFRSGQTIDDDDLVLNLGSCYCTSLWRVHYPTLGEPFWLRSNDQRSNPPCSSIPSFESLCILCSLESLRMTPSTWERKQSLL